MGPIQVRLSASGIGLSAGVRGARVSVGPRGTYVSLTSHGFEYRRKLDTERHRTPAPAPGPSGYSGAGAIPTASVASLQQASPDDIASEIQRCSAREDWFKVYAVGALVLQLIALVSLQGWAAFLLAMLLVGGGLPVYRWNVERKTARLLYDVDDPGAMERFTLASAIGEALGQSASVCHIYSAVHTQDQRRNAGASTLIQRTPTQASHVAFPPIETNLEPWSIAAGPQQLLFLPDRLVVRENGRIAALPYELISAAARETQFIEEGVLPRDAQVIGRTWRYVCKDGTPDLRFSNNYQIPVVRYGEITITSAHGVQIVFQVSHPESASRAAHALNTLADLARKPVPARQWAPAPQAHATAPAAAPVAVRAHLIAPPAGAPRQRKPASPTPTPGPVSTREWNQAGPGPGAGVAVSRESARVPITPPAPPVAPVSVRSEARPLTPPSPPASSHRANPGTVLPWIPPSGSVAVCGYDLKGGMIYVGQGLAPLSGLRNVEPALINPTLAVDRANPNRTGEGMPYWPSYSEIRPADRAAFLEWLAAGRSDPGAYVGYVFLFLYGLERRVLGDTRRAPIAPAERDALQAEITRLLGIYGGNRSFRGYATELLAAMWVGVDVRIYERFAPPLEPHGNELPLLLRLGLGQLVRDGRPIPADWARAWVLCDPLVNLTTPIRRCPDEFRELFRIRYTQICGEGVVLKPGSTALTARYHPASASFGGEITLSAPDVSDPTARKKPIANLHQIAEQCAVELDAYSRWIGRNPDKKGSVAAVGLLPAELVLTHQGAEVDELTRTVERHLGGQAMAIAPAADLLRGASAKAEVLALAQLLQKKGYGMEPDVRFGGELASSEGKMVVFRVPADAPTTASAQYKAATLIVQLAVTIAAADGEVSEPEMRQIEAQLGAMNDLSPSEHTRLVARAHLLVQEPRGLTGLKKRIDGLDTRQKGAVADLIVAMAAADGRIDPAEVKLLIKLFPMLGFDASDVYRRIHALAGANATPAAGPVTAKPGTSSRGFKIPPPAEAEASGVVLDMALVRSKLAETSTVAELLGSIFTEEAPVPAGLDPRPAKAPEPETPAVPPVAGLDARHSSLVRKLAERPSWGRAELEVLTAALGLLPDGALETVNEAAFEACGSAVWSGDDPIEIDSDVMKELCA